MDRITVRLPPELTRRFDAAAASKGGRSRLLRKLIEREAEAALPDHPRTAPARLSGKLTLRLTPDDLACVDAEAAALGLARTQWVGHLIRGRLYGRPQLSPPETIALIEIRRELRRIGVNVNQIARALNTAVLEGAVLDLEINQLAAHQAEIAVWVQAVGDALRGNLEYWAVDP